MIDRLGMVVRSLLKAALGGIDPNNILQRLMAGGRIRAVEGLPQNRSYYVLAKERALGPQALSQRLAVAWHVCVNPGHRIVALKPEELTSLFGKQFPHGAHVLDAGPTPRVLNVYVPDTVEVAPGILRHLDRARAFPRVAQAMANGDYGFLVLVPWRSGLEQDLTTALAAPDLHGISPAFTGQARRLVGLSSQCHFEVHCAPSPDTLQLALQDLKVER